MTILTPHQNYTFKGRPETSDSAVVWEQFVCNTYNIQPSDFNACKTVFDIGANIGAFSAFVMSVDPALRVFAYEPEPNNRALLMENMQLNRLLDKVRIEKQAIGGEKRQAFISDQQGSSRILDSGTPVEMLLLHEIFGLNGVDDVAVLKIDVEGSEYPMIASVPLDTLRMVHKIVMEFHSTSDEVFGALVAKLNIVFDLNIKGNHHSGGLITGNRR